MEMQDFPIDPRTTAYGNWTNAEMEEMLKDGTMEADGPAELRTMEFYFITPLAYELLYSSTDGPNERAKLLVKYGANVNARDLITGKTILDMCLKRNSSERVIQFLRDHQAVTTTSRI